jgi:hypothetical protein
VTGSDSFGFLVDGQSRPIWASLVRVADHVRAGMEVMSTEYDSEPAACAPAGAQQQLRVGPGPILTDRFRGSVPRLPRLPGPPECAAPRTRRHQAMQAMEATTEATKVIYGVNELDLDLAGKSIRGIWKVLEQVLNIPRDAAVSVNGDRVQDDYVVRPGDEIEFQKQAGVKGR